MRRLTMLGLAMGLVVTVGAQTAAPSLTAEETIMVEAVRTVQASAQAACEALPETQRYLALLTKANQALTKNGKQVNWATGAVSALPPKEGAQ